MHLLVFRSLWTNGFDLEAALADCCTGPFDGVEGPVPTDPQARDSFVGEIQAAGVPYIAEVALGGGYVPHASSTPATQLAEWERQLEAAGECRPLLVTVLAGSDRWAPALAVDFLGEVLAAGQRAGLAVAIETHRSRSTYSPWATREILRQLPELRLTCDFSHWCCVCERPVLDEEPALLELVAARALHVHARVGYDQGPQVPDPSAPGYAGFLAAHERWWDAVWTAQAGASIRTTLTPEFGPDGYLQSHPLTGEPAGDLDRINAWMAARQRQRFAASPHARPCHAL